MHRRYFLQTALALPAASALAAEKFDLVAIERGRVLTAADQYLKAEPMTITVAGSPRSAGAKHDFFSEGDYWWPDPK
ncbi:MAG TPA: alginate lyase, partial [Candidatus Sulfopaludibacter sp.]|nr:alginate lyase [Candidatus Sulfopaludibacter sp.]